MRAPNWLGDCIMATPMLRRLKELKPEAEVAVLGLEGHRPVFEGNPNIDRLVLYNSLKGASNFLRTASDTRSKKYDTGYILPNSLSSAFLFALARVGQRTGYDTEGRGWLLNNRVKWPGQIEHRVIRYLRLLGNDPDLEKRARSLSVEMSLTEEDQSKADELLEGVDAKRAVALNPCSITPTRRWFPERFAELAEKIQKDMGFQVVLVGGPSKEDMETTSLVKKLSGMEKITNLAGKTRIKSLAAVLGRLRLLVTCNTGTMHIASTAGTPMVILPGSSDIDITAPWGVEYRVIDKGLDCYPCWKNECPNRAERPECMDSITPDDVMKEVLDLLGQSCRG